MYLSAFSVFVTWMVTIVGQPLMHMAHWECADAKMPCNLRGIGAAIEDGSIMVLILKAGGGC